MSWWTYVVGNVVIDTHSGNESEQSVKEFLESLPETSGSEMPCQYYVNILNGYNVSDYIDGKHSEYQTKYSISIVGHLRDAFADVVREELLNILKKIHVDKWDIDMCSICVFDYSHVINFKKEFCQNELTYVTECDGKETTEVIELE